MPPPPPHAGPLTLSKRLNSGGRELHSISDALVNARLVALFADRQLYGRALGCFYLIHKQLDTCLEKSSNATIKKMQSVLQPMLRTSSYQADLEFYLGPNWREEVAASAPIEAYQDHLAALAEQQPELLLAHSYTQHMAMLSGGRIIRGLARRGMRLGQGEGTAAFEYEGLVGAIRSAYISALDEVGEQMDEATRQQMVEEVKRAFGFNNAIIRSFRMGYLAPLKALLLLTPAAVWAALAAAALGIAAMASMVGGAGRGGGMT